MRTPRFVLNSVAVLFGALIAFALLDVYVTLTWHLQGIFPVWPAFWYAPAFSQTRITEALFALGIVASVLGGLFMLWVGQPWRRWSVWAGLIGSVYVSGLTVSVAFFLMWQGDPHWPWPHLIWPLYISAKTHPTLHLHWWIVFGSFHVLLIFLALWEWQRLHRAKQGLLGHAHFANVFEIAQAKLWQNQGVVLGRALGQVLRRGGFEPVLMCAPTGSGKTATIAIPNLIEWRGSVVVNDLKGELYRLTHAYRFHVLGQSVFLWDPTQRTGQTQGYNPFALVSLIPNEQYRDIALIAEHLIPSTLQGDAFWSDSSRDLLIAFAFYLFETQSETPTLAQIHDLIKRDDLIDWIQQYIEPEKFQAPCIQQTLLALIQLDSRTYSNVMSDFRRRLSLWGDPLIRHSTSHNDFDLRQLRKQPISLYIHITENDMERLSGLLTLFWSQLINVLCEREPNLQQEPYPVLALLDEFANLGKIPKLAKGISFLRSYRLLCVFIIQYHKQLTAIYGLHHGFLNCRTKLVGNLGEWEDAAYYAKALGHKTIRVQQSSRTTQGGLLDGQRTAAVQLQSVPLMRPEELMQLSPRRWIIFCEGHPPVRATKRWWYKSRLLRYQLAKGNAS